MANKIFERGLKTAMQMKMGLAGRTIAAAAIKDPKATLIWGAEVLAMTAAAKMNSAKNM